MPDALDLAAVRPDDWNLALFAHILGAMVVTGAVVLGLIYFAAAWRGDNPAAFRAGFRTLLYAGIPGYIVMRGAPSGSCRRRGSATCRPTRAGSASATSPPTPACCSC